MRRRQHHVETSIFREIRDAVNYGRQARRAVAVIGQPGLGKTHALTWIAEREPAAIYWSVPTARSSLKAVIKALLDAFGYPSEHEHSDRLWQQLEFVVEGFAAGEAFLIIDEAQRLPLDILVEIVDFPERYGLPVVVAGNPELLRRTQVKSGAFDQILSRCAIQLALHKPSDSDLILLAADFDVLGADARAAAVAFGSKTSIWELVVVLETSRAFACRGPVGVQELKKAVMFHKRGRRRSLASKTGRVTGVIAQQRRMEWQST